jgi:phenylacetate-CoA ligase
VYTIFNSDLDQYARETVSRHLSFEHGEWSGQSLALYQETQVRHTLRHVLAGSPFYAAHLGPYVEDAGSTTLAGLRGLPFTTKDDLRNHGTDILSRPVSDAWIFYETTGTTGKATPCPRDNTDSTATNTALTINYASVLRAHPGPHVVGIMGPTELHSTGDAFGEVFRNLGQCVAKIWPHSPVVGYRRALEVMHDLGISALVCTPGMAMSLAREARLAGFSPRDDFRLSFIMVVGELVTPALLDNIRAIWSAEVYNCMYASQEASILAAIRDDGRLRTIPLNNYYEVIDPDTGTEAIPGSDGAQEGELVVTHLFQGCKPLVRYRTGDMVRLAPLPESAEYPSAVLTPLGRVRDLTTIGGRAFSAYELEQAVLENTTACCGYQIVIDNPTGGRDELRVILEYLGAGAAGSLDAGAVRAGVARRLGISPDVEVGEIGTIATTGALVSWKASRVHDKRAGDDAERRAAVAIAARRDQAR